MDSLSILDIFVHAENLSISWIRSDIWMYFYFPEHHNTGKSVNDPWDRPSSISNTCVICILVALQKIPSGLVFYFISTLCESEEIRPIIWVLGIEYWFLIMRSEIFYAYFWPWKPGSVGATFCVHCLPAGFVPLIPLLNKGKNLLPYQFEGILW